MSAPADLILHSRRWCPWKLHVLGAVPPFKVFWFPNFQQRCISPFELESCLPLSQAGLWHRSEDLTEISMRLKEFMIIQSGVSFYWSKIAFSAKLEWVKCWITNQKNRDKNFYVSVAFFYFVLFCFFATGAVSYDVSVSHIHSKQTNQIFFAASWTR